MCAMALSSFLLMMADSRLATNGICFLMCPEGHIGGVLAVASLMAMMGIVLKRTWAKTLEDSSSCSSLRHSIMIWYNGLSWCSAFLYCRRDELHVVRASSASLALLNPEAHQQARLQDSPPQSAMKVTMAFT